MGDQNSVSVGGGDCTVVIAGGGPQQTTPRRTGAHARDHVAAQQRDSHSSDTSTTHGGWLTMAQQCNGGLSLVRREPRPGPSAPFVDAPRGILKHARRCRPARLPPWLQTVAFNRLQAAGGSSRLLLGQKGPGSRPVGARCGPAASRGSQDTRSWFPVKDPTANGGLVVGTGFVTGGEVFDRA